MPRLSKSKINPGVQKLTLRFKKNGLKLFDEELPRRIEALTKELQTDTFETIRIDDFKMSEEVVAKLDQILKSGGDQLAANRKRKVEAVIGNGPTSTSEQPATATSPRLAPHTLVPIASNPRIVAMIQTLKKEYTEALEIAGNLKMWIQLNVPRIEDGNNFGVDVQTECITELSELEDKCCRVLDSTTKYHSGRGKLLTKCIKYPEIQDFRKSIEEVDHMECVNIKMCIRDLRNSYAIIYDMLHKNFDRLEKPKGNGAAMSLY